MEDKNETVVVETPKRKTNAPWILGIVAFAAGFLFFEKFERAKNLRESLGQTESGFGDSAVGWFLLISLICFLASFWGKSKKSFSHGILMISGSLFIIYMALVGPAFARDWGFVSGICYLIGGVFSIINKNRVA